jgi:hypothetical protein
MLTDPGARKRADILEAMEYYKASNYEGTSGPPPAGGSGGGGGIMGIGSTKNEEDGGFGERDVAVMHYIVTRQFLTDKEVDDLSLNREPKVSLVSGFQPKTAPEAAARRDYTYIPRGDLNSGPPSGAKSPATPQMPPRGGGVDPQQLQIHLQQQQQQQQPGQQQPQQAPVQVFPAGVVPRPGDLRSVHSAGTASPREPAAAPPTISQPVETEVVYNAADDDAGDDDDFAALMNKFSSLKTTQAPASAAPGIAEEVNVVPKGAAGAAPVPASEPNSSAAAAAVAAAIDPFTTELPAEESDPFADGEGQGPADGSGDDDLGDEDLMARLAALQQPR